MSLSNNVNTYIILCALVWCMINNCYRSFTLNNRCKIGAIVLLRYQIRHLITIKQRPRHTSCQDIAKSLIGRVVSHWRTDYLTESIIAVVTEMIAKSVVREFSIREKERCAIYDICKTNRLDNEIVAVNESQVRVIIISEIIISAEYRRHT